jgi:hypothetical protein
MIPRTESRWAARHFACAELRDEPAIDADETEQAEQKPKAQELPA